MPGGAARVLRPAGPFADHAAAVRGADLGGPLIFVRRAHRRQGVAEALLRGAVRYARKEGAAVVEGYPHDSAGTTATHRSHSRTFAAAGFRLEGARWVHRGTRRPD